MAGIVFVALGARAIIPLGYMPGDLLAGEFMVLCPSSNAPELFKSEHHAHADHKKSGIDADTTCPIGTVLLVAAISAPLAPSLELPKPELALVVREWGLVAKSVAPRHRSRAPPLA